MDYGKMAYIKTEEIDKKLYAISNSNKVDNTKKVFFTLDDTMELQLGNNFIDEFFLLEGKCNIELTLSGTLTTTTNDNVLIQLSLNNAIVISHRVSGSGVRSFSCGKVLNNITSTSNKLSVKFIASTPITLLTNIISVSGNTLVQYNKHIDIDYNDKFATIAVLTYENKLVVSFDDLITELVEFDLSDKQLKQYRIIYIENFQYIMYLTTKGILHISPLGLVGSDQDRIIKTNVTSFDCTSQTETKIFVACVILGRVYWTTVQSTNVEVGQFNNVSVLSSTDKVVAVKLAFSQSFDCCVIECKGKCVVLRFVNNNFLTDRTIYASNMIFTTINGGILQIYYNENGLVTLSTIVVNSLIGETKKALRYCTKLIPITDGRFLVLDNGRASIE